MDLLKHLEALEAFGDRLGAKPVEIPAPSRLKEWNPPVDEDRQAPSRRRAQALLERLGALPEEASTRERYVEVPTMAPPAIRFRTVDHARLEENLCKLGSVKALTDLLEAGVRDGAFSMVGDRVLVTPPGENEGAGDPVNAVGGYDITPVVHRAAMALKVNESAPVLSRLTTAGVGSPGRAATRDAELPSFVRLRQQEGRSEPVLRDIPDSSPSGIRGRIREFFRRHPAVASQRDLGPDTVLTVAGPPIRLADGAYVPVEVIAEEARNGLLERLQQRDPGRKNAVVFARVDEIEPVSLPEQLASSQPWDGDIDPSSLPSASRVELAYRLVKGLSLTPEAGDPIEVTLRHKLENMLGASFSHVRLHTGPAAKWITESLSARAVTSGANVFISAERMSSPNLADQQTLVHELVHVRQHSENDSDRSRADLELEASMAEHRLAMGDAMAYAGSIRAEARPDMGRTAPGMLMAEEGTEVQQHHKMPGKRKLELRNEQILNALEEKLVKQQEREKEESRDRVF